MKWSISKFLQSENPQYHSKWMNNRWRKVKLPHGVVLIKEFQKCGQTTKKISTHHKKLQKQWFTSIIPAALWVWLKWNSLWNRDLQLMQELSVVALTLMSKDLRTMRDQALPLDKVVSKLKWCLIWTESDTKLAILKKVKVFRKHYHLRISSWSLVFNQLLTLDTSQMSISSKLSLLMMAAHVVLIFPMQVCPSQLYQL